MFKCYASGGNGGGKTSVSNMSHAERREYYRRQRESNRIDYSGQATPQRTLTGFYRSRLPGYDQYGRPMYTTMLGRGRRGG